MAALLDAGTERDLIFLIVKYIRERGVMSMEEICRHHNLSDDFFTFAKSQDKIGWLRFLEGMVSKELPRLVQKRDLDGDIGDVDKWMTLLITQLLEVVHGMWIYRNVVVHDELNGFYAVQGREKLQRAPGRAELGRRVRGWGVAPALVRKRVAGRPAGGAGGVVVAATGLWCCGCDGGGLAAHAGVAAP